jgi:hypothetical protein
MMHVHSYASQGEREEEKKERKAWESMYRTERSMTMHRSHDRSGNYTRPGRKGSRRRVHTIKPALILLASFSLFLSLSLSRRLLLSPLSLSLSQICLFSIIHRLHTNGQARGRKERGAQQDRNRQYTHTLYSIGGSGRRDACALVHCPLFCFA